MKTAARKERGRKGTGWLIKPKVKGGIWYCGFRYKGKRYRWSSESPLKTDAIASLETVIPQIRAGTWRVVTEEVNVKTLVDAWLAAYVKTSRNAKGQRQAKKRAERYLLPYFRNVPAEKVTRDHLRMYRAHLEALTTMKGKVKKPLLTAQTVRHILADARCLFLWAADSGRISASPVPRRLLPKMAESQPRALEPDEQAKVAAVEEPYGLAVRLMIGTGVRWSELCRLQASDVRGGELVVQGETKTKKMRHVPVPPALLAELKNRVGKLVPFEAKDDPSFNRSVRFRCPDVPDFSAHRCRHSFAVNYLTAGGNIRALQLMMGHASLATTEIYMKVSQGMVRDDARRVVGWNPGA